jgi:MFS family permease
MGLQSLGYYALLAWLPTLFHDHHMAAGQAGWMLSFSSFPAMVAALATPTIERRLRRPQAAVVAAVLVCAIGYLGLLADPVPLSYLWMTALGLGQGAAISPALGYIVARSPDHAHTGQLSTMAQGTGYLIACLGPLGLGLLHSATGSREAMAKMPRARVPSASAQVAETAPGAAPSPVTGRSTRCTRRASSPTAVLAPISVPSAPSDAVNPVTSRVPSAAGQLSTVGSCVWLWLCACGSAFPWIRATS